MISASITPQNTALNVRVRVKMDNDKGEDAGSSKKKFEEKEYGDISK